MWGNSLGWGISVVIVTATIAALVWVSRTLNTISGPTDFSAQSGAAEAITTPAAPTGALPDDSAEVDSVSLYRQAIDLYGQNKTLFNEFAQRPNRNDLATVAPAVDLLRKAAGKNSLGIFSATPRDAVSYDIDTPLKALRVVGDCASAAGLLAKTASDKDTATGDLQAAFSLGQRMADERLCYAELGDGLGLMGGAAIEMGEMATDAGDQTRADALNQFAVALSDYANHKLLPIQSVLSSIDQGVVERNVGDFFWLARNSKERMWRVESIMALGRIKYDAGRPGDNRGAVRVLADIATNASDPVIKTAASEARDLTLEQFHFLH
jgi:hypothetical protein